MSSSFDAYIKTLLSRRTDAAQPTRAGPGKVNPALPRAGVLGTLPSNRTGVAPTGGVTAAPSSLPTTTAPSALPEREEPMGPITVEEVQANIPAPTAEYGDIDIIDAGDTQAVSEYVAEIYSYLCLAESRCHIEQYFTRQPSIDAKARAKLIDWMCGVHTSFRLANESIFHAIQILDRFLCYQEVPRSRIELLGISVLYLAAKFEESYTPSIRHFVDAVKGRYTRRNIVQMEATVLSTLNFNLAYPTSITFMRRYAKIAQVPNRERYLAFCLAEICLHDPRFISIPGSKLAAACIYVANKMSSVPAAEQWPAIVAYYSKYELADFLEVAELVEDVALHANESLYTYVINKYSKNQYYEVGKFLVRRATAARSAPMGEH